MSFAGKVVVITGSSSGIGAVTAIQFSKEGAHVVIVGRNENRLKLIAEQCNNPCVINAELGNANDVRRIVEETITKFGKIDVLVNNAVTVSLGNLRDGKVLEALHENYRINIRAPVLLTSLAIPYLIETKGNIVNISSAGAMMPPLFSETLPYCMAKAAINNFTTCAAAEMAAYGVRVNAVSPGPVRTDTVEDFEVTFDDLQKRTALKRLSDPKEIADLIMYLASDKAKGITGSNFLSDNGIILNSN